MPYLFDHLDKVKSALKRAPFGLITDVDGTISRTAPTPEQAEVTPLCRRYLSILCNHLALVAAVSGRAVDKIKSMAGIEGMVYIGNHGLERWHGEREELPEDIGEYHRLIQAAIEELAPLVAEQNITIENKGLTASFHYRLSPDRESARQHILNMIASSPRARGLRIMPERMSIGLLPPIEVNKGTAALGLIREYRLRGACFMGDDLTDVDAFRAIHTTSQGLDFQGLAIAVISQEMPSRLLEEADFTLNGVDAVERFLEWLAKTASELN